LRQTDGMTPAQEQPAPATPEELGRYLKSTRGALGMSLRQVEALTEKSVTNGYLSQIESGDVQQPSPRILHGLAAVYGIDYNDLMERAGYLVAATAPGKRASSVNGFPLRALDDLSADETKAVLEYLEFIKSKR
ncbi:MAG: helix-turn-helix transcriptional regulator, partial [Pseudolysinimonas sp.]